MIILNDKKGEGMIKELVKKIFKETESHEVDRQVMEVILKNLDNANYALDNNLGLTKEDVETIREANNIRLDNKKAKAEIAEKIAKTLGITVAAAGTLVGIILSIKYFKFDKEWMERIYDFKDSLNVMDNKSFNQVSKNKDNHRRFVENMASKKI